MLYTSYFGNLKNIPDSIVPITICGWPIEGWTGLQYKVLAPKWSFFSEWKKNHDNDYYIRNFDELVLKPLNPAKVVQRLYELSEGKDVVMVCYEKPGDFCHRHLVSKWLNDNGFECVEYMNRPSTNNL